MNFRKNFKRQMVLVALGASLVVTGRAYSQEIENTNFENPATSVGGNFNTPVPAQTAAIAPETNSAVVYTSTTPIGIQKAAELESVSLPSVPNSIGMVLTLSVLLLGVIVLWRSAGNRRNARMNTWNSSTPRENAFRTHKAQALQL
jgi:hypothetical protein